MIDFGLINIELLLCGLIAVIFIADLFTNNKNRLYPLAALGSFGILAAAFFIQSSGTTFFGSFVSDGVSGFFKILFLLNAFLVILISKNFLKNNSRYAGEYFILLLSATLGMSLLASSSELITFYISLELLSISSYILSAYQKSNTRSTEAGIKYLLLGAMASGLLLFGMSLVFGAAGSLKYAEIAQVMSGNQASPILYTGIILMLSGLSFKIAVVPFHMWVPDVYEGAPAPVVAFFSVGTKAAGFAVVLRLFLSAFGALKAEWGMIMVIISAATIVYGNLAAIPQTNIRRLLGYSSVAQAGYILMGIAMGTINGISSTLFYLMAYLFSNLSIFVVVIIYGERYGDNIDDYKGLAKRSPIMALVMLIALMSLGGVPPLAGFFGKFYLFAGAIENGFTWLVAIGVLMSVVSIYYYLMVLKRVYIMTSEDTSAIILSFNEKLSLSICAGGTVIFGFFPLPVFTSILSSASSFLK